MEIDTKEIPTNHEGSESKGEMDLEEELISSLCDLRKSRKKNKLLKEEVRELKEKAQNTNKVPKEVDQTIVNLMEQLE